MRIMAVITIIVMRSLTLSLFSGRAQRETPAVTIPPKAERPARHEVRAKLAGKDSAAALRDVESPRERRRTAPRVNLDGAADKILLREVESPNGSPLYAKAISSSRPLSRYAEDSHLFTDNFHFIPIPPRSTCFPSVK